MAPQVKIGDEMTNDREHEELLKIAYSLRGEISHR